MVRAEPTWWGSMALLKNLSAIVGLIGSVITVVTLLKVQSVRRTQHAGGGGDSTLTSA